MIPPGAELEVDRAGDVAILTIAREARRNALTPGVLGALATAIRRAPGEGVRALVLTGKGTLAFSAGYDLEALARDGDRAAEAALGDAAAAISASPLPIVCALNGVCVGGGVELAIRCDQRLAQPDVELRMPPARLGIVYASAGLARIAALAGEARARRIFLFAEPVRAEVACAWGLIDEVVPADELAARARALADQAAALAPLAVAGMRRTFEALLAARTTLPPDDAGAIEAARREAWASADAAEALAAFRERRAPRFRGG